MAFIPVTNVVQFSVRYTPPDGVSLVENVLHFLSTSPPYSPAQMLTAATELYTLWVANILPSLSNRWALKEVYAVDLTTQSGPTTTYVPPTPDVGGLDSQSVPQNCALCLTLRTAQRGRSYRGRCYIPGLAEASVDASILTSAVGIDLRDGLGDVIIGMSAISWIASIVSRQENGTPRTSGLVTPITNVAVRDFVIDSQRRRTPGRGA